MNLGGISGAILGIALVASSLAHAEIQVQAEPLFQPYYRAGRLLPVRVRIASDSDAPLVATIVIEQNTGGGLYAHVARQSLTIPPHSRREIVTHAACPDPMRELELRVLGAKGDVIAKHTLRSDPVEERERVVAVIGKEPVGLLSLAHGDPAVHTVHLGEVWPTTWAQWLAVDLVVWPDPEPATLGDAERDALTRWLAQGGVLVVATPRGDVPLRNSFLAPLLPVAIAPEIDVAPLTGVDVPPITRAHFQRHRGRITIGDEADPVVVVGRHAMGRIAVVAFDLRATPFVRGHGAAAFWRSCLEDLLPQRPEPDDQDPNRGHYSFGSVVQSLDAVLRRMPAVRIAGVWWVTGLLAAYLLAIGPLDWWLQRRYRRNRLSWLTYPAFIVVFSAAILLAAEWQRRDGFTVRAITIEDHKDGVVRARGRVALAGEKSRALDLENHSAHDLRVLRAGSGGGAALGMAAEVLERELSLDGSARALHTAIDAWQTATVELAWVGDSSAAIAVEWSGDTPRLRSDLEFPLDSVVVVRGDRAWPIGLLAPGQVASVARAVALVEQVRATPLQPSDNVIHGLDTLRRVLLVASFQTAVNQSASSEEAGVSWLMGNADERAAWMDLSDYPDCVIVLGFADGTPPPFAVAGASRIDHYRFYRQIQCETQP